MLKQISTTHQKSHVTATPEVSRLITAAVINNSFRSNLLANPAQAVAKGYKGERFMLNHAEKQQVTAIQASNLVDFAAQLKESLSHQKKKE